MNKKILHFKINVKNKMIAFKTRCKKCRKLNKKYFTFGFYTILGTFGPFVIGILAGLILTASILAAQGK